MSGLDKNNGDRLISFLIRPLSAFFPINFPRQVLYLRSYSKKYKIVII